MLVVSCGYDLLLGPDDGAQASSRSSRRTTSSLRTPYRTMCSNEAKRRTSAIVRQGVRALEPEDRGDGQPAGGLRMGPRSIAAVQASRRGRLTSVTQRKCRATPISESDDRERRRRALAMLPDAQREVIVLIEWLGMTSEEAGKVLGVSPGAVRVRLTRAKQALSLSRRRGTRMSELQGILDREARRVSAEPGALRRPRHRVDRRRRNRRVATAIFALALAGARPRHPRAGVRAAAEPALSLRRSLRRTSVISGWPGTRRPAVAAPRPARAATASTSDGTTGSWRTRRTARHGAGPAIPSGSAP